MNDYLWDRSGEPDATTQHLEELLAVYRHQGKLRTRSRWSRSAPVIRWAVAAMIAIAVVMFVRTTSKNAWRATLLAGVSSLPTGALHPGDEVRTDATSRIRLESRAIGSIELAPRTTLRLVENRGRRHRLALVEGSVHARTTSAPGVFIVDTPRASAVDLGCDYTLTIGPDGSGVLRVTAGWVELENDAQSLVPRGAAATILANGELTAPYFENAAPELRAAVITFQTARGAERGAALAQILTHARQRDGLTLINLFSRADPAQRLLIFDRLNELVPAPPTVRREALGNWNVRTTGDWWPRVVKAARVPPLEKKGKSAWW